MSDIIPNDDNAIRKYTGDKTGQALVSWIMSRVEDWEDHRDTNFRKEWEEFWRLWRGKWKPEDKTRQSERSKLISPALMQAIEATVAELEESTFGKGKFWFDVEDDVADEQKEDLLFIRNRLLEDLDLAEVPNEVAKVYLYGALFGTGIAKILIEPKERKTMMAQKVSSVFGNETVPRANTVREVQVKMEAIHPLNFVIDPAARSIDEALGCAHVVIKPTHSVVMKQAAGIYNPGDIGSYEGTVDIMENDEGRSNMGGYTKLVEYHGLVPRAMVKDVEEDIAELFEEEGEEEIDETDLIEAIVTIANDSFLLRAIENPHVMKDRGFVAYQHDIVPNSFWGRGVAEKGYNPQKALDADLRARIDAMALITHPMMAADSTRLPRGQKLTVSPGKMLLTNGDPSTVFMPFKFGSLEASSFAQTSDLERMIQVGTGAVDTASPVGINPRNSTASGMSMMTASTLKRQKRAKQNIDRQFLNKFIEKSLWRHMQYNPERYPAADYKFVVKSTMGLMAREYEQAQLTQLLSIIPPDSPVFAIIMKGVIDNSSLENKGELLQALAQSQQPDPQQQQMQQMIQQLQIQNQQLINEKLKSEVAENYAQAQNYGAKAQLDGYNAETNRITAITNATREKGNNGK